jgi:TRAP-type C4-dicarboxylate transport system permease small subunit
MPTLKSTFAWLDEHLEETVLIILLIAITLLTGMQVVMRKVFQNPLTWSEELCRFCFVWSGFWGIGYFIRKECAIRITTLVSAMPPTVQRLMNIAADLISIAFFALFLQASFVAVQQVHASGQVSPAMGLPISILYFGALLGFLFALIRMIQALCSEIKALVNKEPIADTGDSALGGGN